MCSSDLKLSAWSDQQIVDGFTGATGEVALQGAKRLSFTTSGRSQAYALTLLVGILLMAAWLLANPASSTLLRPLR